MKDNIIVFRKMTFAILFIFLLLFFLSFTGAITFPSLPGPTGSLTHYFYEILVLLVPALVLTLVGRPLGAGVVLMSLKNPFEARILTYVGVLLLGGILALMTFLNIPFSAHLNLQWLGGLWYDQWLTMFVVGAPMMLAFLA